MHGVSTDLPFAPFVGQECNQVALGRFQIQFHFSGVGSIHAESRWELCNDKGEIIDASCEHAKRDCYRVHRILDVPVVRFVIGSPRSFTLYFESGGALTVFDDSDSYESFSIHLNSGGRIYI